jgi:hypothetical protein
VHVGYHANVQPKLCSRETSFSAFRLPSAAEQLAVKFILLIKVESGLPGYFWIAFCAELSFCYFGKGHLKYRQLVQGHH